MRIILIIACYFAIQTVSISQHRIAVYKTTGPSKTQSSFSEVSNRIINSYGSDERFIVIDKANNNLIKDEQERQKSEEFIDGYIVDQGKQEGYDYVIQPTYISKDKTLSLRVYDIAKGTVISSPKAKIKMSLLGIPKNLDVAVKTLVDKVNIDCFDIRYEILRKIDDKKGKVKTLLTVIGYNQNAKEKDVFDIYNQVTEKIGDKEISRKNVVGKGEIEEVQDANFSVLKVKEGGKEIYNLLESGTQLYASPSKK